MIEFKPYESKPIVRMAYQITDKDSVEEGFDGTSTWFIGMLTFKAYQEPKVGDWIVRLTEEDTYHVTDEVFRERNIVND